MSGTDIVVPAKLLKRLRKWIPHASLKELPVSLEENFDRLPSETDRKSETPQPGLRTLL